MSTESISLSNPPLKSVVIPPSVFQAELTPGGLKAIKTSEGATRIDNFYSYPLDKVNVVKDLNARITTPDVLARIRMIADSMKDVGFRIDRPISCFVEKRDGVDRIVVWDGHTRFAAAQLAVSEGADIPTVPVCLMPKSTSMDDIMFGLVTANSGQPLSMLETALVVKRLQARGIDDSIIAQKIGVTTTHIDNLSILAGSPKSIHQMVAANQVAASTVIELIKKIGVEKTLAQLSEQIAAAQAAGKENIKITSKNLPSVKFQSALKKSAPRLFEHASAIRKDPAYGQLSSETREQLEALLEELEAARPAA
ncbi:hypothetical protein LMG667_19745 [Xanthomonas euvesicatoria]|uniref:ParB/RepB/Spo0J family partition protein n=1 Tax=Xanthomonas euvesicatoria TaxID=456327 RepID=UPI00080E6343|nr:hypothetical protein [Xanthomonas euvesicatoria]OCG82130.1 hypothetical protein LMG667_19745 [Xanthomonas euvesicatoria]